MISVREKIVEPKPGLLGLLERAKQPGSVSRACKAMGYSRDSFCRFEELCERGGAEALMALDREKPLPKTRGPEHGERAAIERTVETPALGQKRASWELRRKGVAGSSSGERSVWPRNDPETPKKRTKAPGKAQRHEEAHSGIERATAPVIWAARTLTTCHAGTMKGAGRISRYRHFRRYPCPRGDPQALHREDGDRRPRPVEPCRTTGPPPSLPRMASAYRASRPTGAPNRH